MRITFAKRNDGAKNRLMKIQYYALYNSIAKAQK